MRILIVEDEFKLALLVSERLKRENYQTEIATDATEVIPMFAA